MRVGTGKCPVTLPAFVPAAFDGMRSLQNAAGECAIKVTIVTTRSTRKSFIERQSVIGSAFPPRPQTQEFSEDVAAISRALPAIGECEDTTP